MSATKLNIPFYTNSKMDCGPVCLQMVANFYDHKIDLEYARSLVDPEHSGASWTIGIATALAQLGLNVSFYSTSIYPNDQNFELEYYQNYSDSNSSATSKILGFIQQAKVLNIKLYEQEASYSQITNNIELGFSQIVLLDWSKIIGADKYIGHFVVVSGYDADNILVHNPGPELASPFMPISIEKFETARKSRGTDQDLVLVNS